jgi:hypothetical protein
MLKSVFREYATVHICPKLYVGVPVRTMDALLLRQAIASEFRRSQSYTLLYREHQSEHRYKIGLAARHNATSRTYQDHNVQSTKAIRSAINTALQTSVISMFTNIHKYMYVAPSIWMLLVSHLNTQNWSTADHAHSQLARASRQTNKY